MASLTLQIFLTADYYMQWVFVYITAVLMFYKIYLYSFPLGIFFLEALVFIVLVLAQFARIFLGSRGNKTESSTVTFLFILLTLGTIIGNLYFIQVQTYVIVIETVIGLLSIAFGAFEFLFGIIAAIEFKSLENSQ